LVSEKDDLEHLNESAAHHHVEDQSNSCPALVDDVVCVLLEEEFWKHVRSQSERVHAPQQEGQFHRCHKVGGFSDEFSRCEGEDPSEEQRLQEEEGALTDPVL